MSKKMRVLVADKLDEQGLAILLKEPLLQVDVKTGLKPADLAKAIFPYHAVVVRSATKITKEILKKADNLKVIGRAGVGVDNVDLPAATEKGVIVMNTPEGNTISAAEHTVSMLLSLTRNIPQADASMKKGEWNRGKFMGSELLGKTLGVVGFGRIGREVSKRAASFGMNLLVYDPFLSPEAMEKEGIEATRNVSHVFKRSDYITIHVPLTKDTHHLIGKEAFAVMKKGVRIINCARGGIIDETALCEAIKSGKVRGAALDVFEQEPPDFSHPLFQLPQVVFTPHLGASTEEAQVGVSVAVAEQIADALLDRGIRNAVNLPSLDAKSAQVLKPWLNLAEKLGSFYTQLLGGDINELIVEYSGEVTKHKLAPLTNALLKGLLQPISGGIVNYVNAPALASQRGIKVLESKASEVGDFVNTITLKVRSGKKKNIVIGTLFAEKHPRIVRVNDVYMESVPNGHMLAVFNLDKPGVVGVVGTVLAKNKINIAEMTLGRNPQGTHAITIINTDQPIPGAVIQELKKHRLIVDARVVNL